MSHEVFSRMHAFHEQRNLETRRDFALERTNQLLKENLNHLREICPWLPESLTIIDTSRQIAAYTAEQFMMLEDIALTDPAQARETLKQQFKQRFGVDIADWITQVPKGGGWELTTHWQQQPIEFRHYAVSKAPEVVKDLAAGGIAQVGVAIFDALVTNQYAQKLQLDQQSYFFYTQEGYVIELQQTWISKDGNGERLVIYQSSTIPAKETHRSEITRFRDGVSRIVFNPTGFQIEDQKWHLEVSTQDTVDYEGWPMNLVDTTRYTRTSNQQQTGQLPFTIVDRTIVLNEVDGTNHPIIPATSDQAIALNVLLTILRDQQIMALLKPSKQGALVSLGVNHLVFDNLNALQETETFVTSQSLDDDFYRKCMAQILHQKKQKTSRRTFGVVPTEQLQQMTVTDLLELVSTMKTGTLPEEFQYLVSYWGDHFKSEEVKIEVLLPDENDQVTLPLVESFGGITTLTLCTQQGKYIKIPDQQCRYSESPDFMLGAITEA